MNNELRVKLIKKANDLIIGKEYDVICIDLYLDTEEFIGELLLEIEQQVSTLILAILNMFLSLYFKMNYLIKISFQITPFKYFKTVFYSQYYITVVLF